ncbi:MAG: TraR/DksA family transcriptional regulator [Planctomycetota bacterium]|jgi:DnaK suppressor protein
MQKLPRGGRQHLTAGMLTSMPMTKTDLDKFQGQLQFVRARLQGDMSDIREGAFGHEDSDSRTPNHMAELGSENYEQDFALDLIRNEQETLGEIAAALGRIEDGTYGQCEGCLEEGVSGRKALIPKTRLKAIPWARNCVECERKRETQYT